MKNKTPFIYSATYEKDIERQNRITSYNVCYTKLLRYCATLDKKPDLTKSYIVTAVGTNTIDKDVEIANLNDLIKKEEPVIEKTPYIAGLYEDVITSYSIHYTKLYDKNILMRNVVIIIQHWIFKHMLRILKLEVIETMLQQILLQLAKMVGMHIYNLNK